MNEMNPRIVPGSNNPPLTLEEIIAQLKRLDIAAELKAKSEEDLRALAEFLSDTANPPAKIQSKEVHEKVVESIKKGRAIKKKMTDSRDTWRSPFGQSYDEVNGFYNKRTDEADRRITELNKLHKDFSDQEAAKERDRLRREAEEKRAAEEAAMRLAQDAERTKGDAESARRMAEQAAELAAQARELAVGAVAEAQAVLFEARSDGARVKVKIADVRADFARRRKDKDPTATKEAEDTARAALQAEIDDIAERIKTAEAGLAARKAEADEAKRKQREAEEAEAAEERKTREAERNRRAALEEAVRHDKSASKIEEKVKGPDADLARVHTEHGAVGTLTRQWQCDITDDALLDKAALWPFISFDAKQAALRKWMLQQPQDRRKMAGASMYEDTVGSVR
jgi:hypothetical protein